MQRTTISFVKIGFQILIAFAFIKQSNAQMVDAGNGHAIYLNEDGEVYTIGRNNYGQLGDSTLVNSSVPIKVRLKTKAKYISRGYDHSIAIDENGDIWLWGRNNYGQIGSELLLDALVPYKVQKHGNFVQAAGGHWHTIALKKDGTVWAWGHNYFGELGNGNREHYNLPQKVLSLDKKQLKGIAYIATVGYHNLAIDSNGVVYGWGSNDIGQLMHNNKSYMLYAEILNHVPQNISMVATGWHFSLALDSTGSVWSWGNQPNALGFDTSKIRKARKIESLKAIQQIACGSWHSMALDSNGKVSSWGNNQFGMLGCGNNNHSSTPLALKSDLEFSTIGGGCFNSMAIDKSNDLWIWGDNPSGQLATTKVNRSNLPVKVIINQKTQQINSNTPIAKGEFNLFNYKNIVLSWIIISLVLTSILKRFKV